MALYKDMPDTDKRKAISKEANQYLDDPEKGIGLIKSMLNRRSKDAAAADFEIILNTKVFPILAELELDNELELYRALMKISKKIQEHRKISILEGKKVVGVGGKFSSGKSSFINAITNSRLPEGQRPTTSIATYIVNADTDKSIAISRTDSEIELNELEMNALTHQFYAKYKIGFSRLLQNIVVYTPGFTYPNIAILDTPGYSKADDSKNRNNTDAELAKDQLKAVDYLIWLVDSTQGVITDKDLTFLDSLNISTKILIVFTKADTEILENITKKIDQARISLSLINKNIYDIIAYDSRNKVTVVGDGVLESFLEMINSDNSVSEKNDIVLETYRNDLVSQLNGQISECTDIIGAHEKMMNGASNIQHILAVINDYQHKKILLNRIEYCKSQLIKYFDILISLSREQRFG